MPKIKKIFVEFGDNQENLNIQALTINGKEYAKYLMEDGLLYLNVLDSNIHKMRYDYENYLTELISMIEERDFTGVAYLNV